MKIPTSQDHIWVSSAPNASEEGSYEQPYSSIAKAVEKALPGQTVVLKAGTYSGDVTIEHGGTMEKPLRIIAEKGAVVQCVGSCWYFYDVTDIICSGILFKESPGMAIAVMGKCERNRFELLQFMDCSLTKENACTFFFGGSGQFCNIVESCDFFQNGAKRQSLKNQPSLSIGIMIAEGDFQQGEPNRDCIVSKNRFSGYGYGILLGSHDDSPGQYGHRVMYNTVENCFHEGIMAKCGDTLIKGNLIKNCSRNSISLAAGVGSIVEENRILDCGQGIRICGMGHTVSNNCVVRARESAISIVSNNAAQAAEATNVIVERNTLVNWGHGAAKPLSGIAIEAQTTCVICNNLLHGKGKPYEIFNRSDTTPAPCDREKFLIQNNAVSDECEELDGGVRRAAVFLAASFDNYANDSGYGATGWMLTPEAFDPGAEIFSSCGEGSPDAYREEPEGEAEETVEETDEGTDEETDEGGSLARSIFLPDEQDA